MFNYNEDITIKHLKPDDLYDDRKVMSMGNKSVIFIIKKINDKIHFRLYYDINLNKDVDNNDWRLSNRNDDWLETTHTIEYNRGKERDLKLKELLDENN